MKLKHFLRRNVNVSEKGATAKVKIMLNKGKGKPSTIFRYRLQMEVKGGAAEISGLSQDSAYTVAKEFNECVGAIISYGTCLAVLYPGDMSGWILLRLLQVSEWERGRIGLKITPLFSGISFPAAYQECSPQGEPRDRAL